MKIDWRSIEGLTSHSELEKLEQLCEEISQKVKNPLFAEIGSYKGKSACVMAQFGKVYAFDTGGDLYHGAENPQMVGINTFSTLLQNLAERSLMPERVVPICSTGKELSFFRVRFDLIFVDGDHRLEPCLEDLNTAYCAVKRDGVIVVHDYNPALAVENEYEVHKAVDEFLRSYHVRVPEFMPLASFELFESLAILKFGG